MKLSLNNTLYLLVVTLFLAACGDGNETPPVSGNDPNLVRPRLITYSIVNTYPHDTALYTQGLEFYKGKLYEGTGSGSYAGSFLLEMDYTTGKSNRRIKLADEFFGEGITVVNDTLYQLTWQNKKVFAYDVASFKKIAEYSINTEGWGLTNNGKELIVSDGTSVLYYYEPGTFRMLRSQTVMEAGKLTSNLNELEFVDGYVYANQYQLPYVLKIDPSNGQIVGKIDLTDLWTRARALQPTVDVPNGIAYDSTKKSFFLTGKLWPEMYEVKFGE